MPLGGLTDEIDVEVFRSHIKIPLIFLVPAAFTITLYASVYMYANSGWFLDDLTASLHAKMGGRFGVDELVVDPGLTDAHLYGVDLDTPDGQPVIDAREIVASVNPLVLLSGRLSFDQAKLRGADVRLDFDEQGHFGLLEALGVDEDASEEDESGGDGLAVELSNIVVEDSQLWLSVPGFQFHAPSLDIPRASIAIDPEALLMRVPELAVPRVELEFDHELMNFDAARGDWAFTVHNFQVSDWQWSNQGFNVGEVNFEADGAQLTAQGAMSFPSGEGPDVPEMTYDATASLSIPPWSRLAQYFLEDAVHFAAPDLQVAARGSLDQIDGAVQLHASFLEIAGLHVNDVDARLGLTNQWLEVSRARANVHGGQVTVPEASFNISTTQYAARGSFEGVNPYALLQDVDVDLPFLDGRVSGGFELTGGVPRFPDELGAAPVYGLRNFATQRLVDVTVTDPWVLRRDNHLLAPASRVVLDEGASAWVDANRVVVPRAKLRLGADTVDLHDFRFDYDDSTFLKGPDDGAIQMSAHVANVGPWTAMYGIEGVGGPVDIHAAVDGALAWPSVIVDFQNRREPLSVPGAEIAAGDVAIHAQLDDGRLDIDEASVSTRLGSASVSGWVELLRPAGGPSDPRSGGADHSELAVRRIQPVDLRFSAESVDVGAIAGLAGSDVPVDGRLTASGTLSGTLQSPTGRLQAKVVDGQAVGQSIRRLKLAATVGDQRLQVDELMVDGAEAGRLEASGYYGWDGAYGFELEAPAVELAKVAPLADLPAVSRPRGQARVSLHGHGTVDDPAIGGDLQLHDLRVGSRTVGDVALVVNTVDDTVYLSGALMSLGALKVEIPLDDTSPFYARLGMDGLELTDVVDELDRSPVVSRARATGMVEVFVEKDFSRFQVLSYLTSLKVDTLGRTLTSRGPLVFGFNNGDVFQIQQATIGTGDRYLSIQGAVAANPALVDLELSGQLDLSMLNTLRRTAPAVFPPAFVESHGIVDVDTTVRGQPDALTANGTIGFRQAEVALRSLSEPVRIDRGTVHLDDDRIYVSDDEPLNGTLLGGVYSIAGQLSLHGNRPRKLDVHAWSHNMNYRVSDAANFSFDTDVRLTADDVFRPETWLVSGRVDVLDGKFYRDISLFEEEVTGRVLGAFSRQTDRYEAGVFEQVPALDDIRFDLSLRAREGFEIHNEIDRLTLDLGLRADLQLQETLADPRVTGNIDIADGVIGFQGEEFKVRSGRVRFTGEPANPRIEVTTGADIRNRCREEQFGRNFDTDLRLSGDLTEDEDQFYHVMLKLDGRADNLDIEFDSNPYADQRDILSLLLTGCTVDQLSASSASGPTLEVVLGPLLGRIEKEVQDVVKVSEFTIMPGVERTQVRIGDRLTRRLSWNFELDTGMDQTAGGQRSQLEYKLTDRWAAELSGERQETETTNFLLDLKLKYRLPLE